MVGRIVAILFPLAAIAALGAAVGRRSKPDLSVANRLNMDVFVPCVVFSALASKGLRIETFLPLAGVTLAMLVLSGLAGWGAARLSGADPRTLVPPVMFNNCGNLGLPVAVLAFGEQALAPAVVMFMMSMLLQFSFGVWLVDRRAGIAGLWKVPSVLASVAGVAVSALRLELWPPLATAVKMVGDIAIPLMLFSLGVRLSEGQSRDTWRIGLGGGLLRPVVGLVLGLALARLVPLPPLERSLVVVFGALPPAVLAYIFAERHQQEPHKVASIVVVGNVLALVFLPVALALTLER